MYDLTLHILAKLIFTPRIFPISYLAQRVAWLLLDCARRTSPTLNSSPVFSEAAGMVSTARIERPLLHRGGSASIETMPVASLSPSEAARSWSKEPT